MCVNTECLGLMSCNARIIIGIIQFKYTSVAEIKQKYTHISLLSSSISLFYLLQELDFFFLFIQPF